MAAIQNFRKSINGFNREDVVQYIEYMNNKHTSQLNQLKTELQAQKDELAALRSRPEPNPTLEASLADAESAKADLEQQLQEAQNEIASLKLQLEQAQAALDAKPSRDELEVYRRAERFERLAGERVTQLYDRANAALAQSTACADDSASQIAQLADSISQQLADMQAVLAHSKQSVQEAADAMHEICPIDPDR